MVGNAEYEHVRDLVNPKKDAADVGTALDQMGFEVDKRNYLVLVEARLATNRDVNYEAVPLDLVMASAEVASTLGLVILNACRDNPFLAMMRSTGLARSVDRGLARVEPLGSSMMVAYSAKEGTTAADGEPGGNSPYAAALLKHLERPELHVGDLFIEVRKEMLSAPGSQTPVEYGALVEKIFLASTDLPPPTQ